MQRVDFGDLDLQVNSSSEWRFKRGGDERSSVRCYLFEHELGAVQLKIGKKLLRPLIADSEAADADVEVHTCRKVRAVELRHDPRAAHAQSGLSTLRPTG